MDLLSSYATLARDEPANFGEAYTRFLFEHETLRKELVDAVRAELGITPK